MIDKRRKKVELKWITQFKVEDIPTVLFSFSLADIFKRDYPTITVTPTLQPQDIQLDSSLLHLAVQGFFSPPDTISNTPKQHIKGTAKDGDHRAVYQFVGPSTGLPFRCGLTVHLSNGTWSSTPHKFEKEGILSPRPMLFTEQFAYLTYPSYSWGVQVKTGHLDGGMVNTVEFIADRDIKSIPLGSHPVSAGPGTRMAYWWLYTAGDLSLMEKFDE